MKRLLILLLTGLFAAAGSFIVTRKAQITLKTMMLPLQTTTKVLISVLSPPFRFLTRSFILRMTIVPANLHMNLMMLSSKL